MTLKSDLTYFREIFYFYSLNKRQCHIPPWSSLLNGFLWQTIMKRILLIFLCSFVYIGTDAQSPISSNVEQLEKIEIHTRNTESNTNKDFWFYMSFGISAVSLVIAAITFHVSRKTLKSQRITESNTRKWSAKQERFVLRNITNKLMDNIATILLYEVYKVRYPKSFIFEDMKIDTSQLHINDTFLDDVDYQGLCLVYYELEMYNQYLDRWKKNAEDSAPFDLSKEEYLKPIRIIDSISTLYERMFTEHERKARDRRRNVYNNSLTELVTRLCDRERAKETLICLAEKNNYDFEKQYAKSNMYTQRNVGYNYLRATLLSNMIQLPESIDDELWFHFYNIYNNTTNHFLGEEYQETENAWKELNNSILFSIETKELYPLPFKYDGKIIKPNTGKTEISIDDEKLAVLLKCVQVNAMFMAIPMDLYCGDEVDGFSYTEENGGTLYSFDFEDYKNLIRTEKNRTIEIQIDPNLCSVIMVLPNDMPYERKLTVIKERRNDLKEILRPIRQFVCTNNESNGRTMVSTFSVSNVTIGQEGVLRIKLKDQLSLKIV